VIVGIPVCVTDDVAALVHAAWLARDVLAALDAPTGARPRGTR
jgi:hypothetical protein